MVGLLATSIKSIYNRIQLERYEWKENRSNYGEKTYIESGQKILYYRGQIEKDERYANIFSRCLISVSLGYHYHKAHPLPINTKETAAGAEVNLPIFWELCEEERIKLDKEIAKIPQPINAGTSESNKAIIIKSILNNSYFLLKNAEDNWSYLIAEKRSKIQAVADKWENEDSKKLEELAQQISEAKKELHDRIYNCTKEARAKGYSLAYFPTRFYNDYSITSTH